VFVLYRDSPPCRQSQSRHLACRRAANHMPALLSQFVMLSLS
jgi:hypothetical protein